MCPLRVYKSVLYRAKELKYISIYKFTYIPVSAWQLLTSEPKEQIFFFHIFTLKMCLEKENRLTLLLLP